METRGVDIPNPKFWRWDIAVEGWFPFSAARCWQILIFYTGAFPAEYGNALAGVFDMKLRTGNNEKREYTIQAGVLGIDISSEGPFKMGRNAPII